MGVHWTPFFEVKKGDAGSILRGPDDVMDKAKFEGLLKECLETSERPKRDIKLRLNFATESDRLHFTKDIIAMANSLGPEPAYIIYGVAEAKNTGHRKGVGISEHYDDCQLQSLIKGKVSPYPNFLYEEWKIGDLTYGVVEVQMGLQPYQTHQEGIFYIRKGTTNSAADWSDLELLRIDREYVREHRLAAGRSPVGTEEHPALKWRPKFVVDNPIVKVRSSYVIRSGDWVLAKFQEEPSAKWKDPKPELVGLWDEKTKVLTELQHLRAEGSSTARASARLCIPGYDVDVEWRERALVYGPPWNSLKRHAVKEFLNRCTGKLMICQVVYSGADDRGPFILLNSRDYDSYLTSELPYYKGLETALSRPQWYNPRKPLPKRRLRRYLEDVLMPSGALEALVPDRYKAKWNGRTIQLPIAWMILKGLIERNIVHRVDAGPSRMPGHADVRHHSPAGYRLDP